MSGGLGSKWFQGLGWLLALLLSGLTAPRVYHRLINQLPPVQQGYWDTALAQKKQELSAPWQDSRPLVIMAGDSQIELGNWYAFFFGKWSMRNCGLAGAQVADVRQLISSVHDSHPQMVVLMCGVNDLRNGRTPDATLQDYERLLADVQSQLKPDSILVLSVMPVRESAIDRAAQECNVRIREFNGKLAGCCQQWQANFLDVSSAVADAHRGLNHELTTDGLHLNPDGYRRLAAIIAPHLPQIASAP